MTFYCYCQSPRGFLQGQTESSVPLPRKSVILDPFYIKWDFGQIMEKCILGGINHGSCNMIKLSKRCTVTLDLELLGYRRTPHLFFHNFYVQYSCEQLAHQILKKMIFFVNHLNTYLLSFGLDYHYVLYSIVSMWTIITHQLPLVLTNSTILRWAKMWGVKNHLTLLSLGGILPTWHNIF